MQISIPLSVLYFRGSYLWDSLILEIFFEAFKINSSKYNKGQIFSLSILIGPWFCGDFLCDNDVYDIPATCATDQFLTKAGMQAYEN